MCISCIGRWILYHWATWEALCHVKWLNHWHFSSVQFSHSVVSNSCSPMNCSTPGFPVHHQLPELAQTHVHRVSDAIQPSQPLSSPSPPAFNLAQHQGLFQWVLQMRWPKYWSFSFSISPSNEYSGQISFRIDCLYLLAVQGTLRSLFQHHSSKASVLRHAYYMPEDNNTPISEGPNFSSNQQVVFSFMAATPYEVILEPPKIKSVTISPPICHE